jgi:hypothetical protein
MKSKTVNDYVLNLQDLYNLATQPVPFKTILMVCLLCLFWFSYNHKIKSQIYFYSVPRFFIVNNSKIKNSYMFYDTNFHNPLLNGSSIVHLKTFHGHHVHPV